MPTESTEQAWVTQTMIKQNIQIVHAFWVKRELLRKINIYFPEIGREGGEDKNSLS